MNYLVNGLIAFAMLVMGLYIYTVSILWFQGLIMKMNIDTLVKEHGGFFAFSNTQFYEKATTNVEYTRTGVAGLILPKHKVDLFFRNLEDFQKKVTRDDLKRNTRKDIIWRELANYECQITGDISDVVDALAFHEITRAEIMAEFPSYMQYCKKHDLF